MLKTVHRTQQIPTDVSYYYTPVIPDQNVIRNLSTKKRRRNCKIAKNNPNKTKTKIKTAPL